MKVFVIHARRTGYGVVRSLNKYTKDIYVADTNITPVFNSKYIKKSFIVPDIVNTPPNQFIKHLINIAHEMNYTDEKPVVFTGKDDYLMFFSKHYKQLSKYFILSFDSNYKRLKSALSKKELITTSHQSKVSIPLSFTDENSIDEILNQINFPVIIKPAIKNTPTIDVVKTIFRLKKCYTPSELTIAIDQLNEHSVPYVIQEYIPGNDSSLITMGTYSYKGKLKAWSTSKKVRQFPPNTGECSLGITIYEKELVPLAERLLKTLQLTGISQIEFKKHQDKYYLIEINPRIWSWHEINRKVGVNLCKIACDHIGGKSNNTIITPIPKKVKWVFPTMDYLHNIKLNKNINLFTLIKDFITSDIKAFFNIRDLSPFYYHIKSTLTYIKSFR